MRSSPVFLARIDLLIPQLGWALVSAADGTPTIKQPFLAKLPIVDADTGANQHSYYTEGSAVMCVRDLHAVDLAYIVGPACFAATDPRSNELRAAAIYNLDDKDLEAAENGGEGFRQAMEERLHGRSIRFQAYDHGSDIDAMPGDSDTIDLRGNAGIHVGRYLAQLRGSPICYIDASNITNKIRLVAPAIEEHGPLSFRLTDKDLSVSNTAISENEAFGVSGTPMKIEDGELVLDKPNALPLYRIQQTEGAAIDGKELLVVSAPADAHYCTTEAPILAKKRVSLSGELSEVSAAAISSVKTPLIQAVHQINYSKARSQQEQEDILQPWAYPDYTEEEQAELTEEQRKAEIDDAAINRIIDKLLTGDYLEKLKSKMAEHGLKVSDGDTSMATIGNQTTGPTINAAYDPPPYLRLTDPVSGKTTDYYASTSFITQEADGSILICDGYGSEIRMSRGNIYISPALDLFLRPGRDLSAMVPRHQSFNAQEHTTINSSKSVYIRAVNDLKMAGGTDGLGMVTLECMAKNKASNTGLMLKSGCGTTVIGNDIYIGRNTGNGTTEGRIQEPKQAGSIIIDACASGVISERSVEHVIDTQSAYFVASQNNAAAAIRVAPTMIGIYANGVEMPAIVNITGKRSQEQVTVVRNGQQYNIRLSTYSGDPQLTVGGAVVVGSRIWCNGAGWFCGAVGANGIISTSQYCSVADTSNGNDPFKKIEIKKQEPHNDGSAAAVYISTEASRYNYQDAYVTYNGFAFPLSYNITAPLRVPGMMWQTNVDSIRNGRRWLERVVEASGSTTMCYPGIEVWQSEEYAVSGTDYELLSVNGNYITNVPKGN